MRKSARKIGAVLGILGVIFGGLAFPTEAGAISLKEGGVDTSCEKNLFGMRPWYAGLAVKVNGKCQVGTPASDSEIPTFTWMIILNVMSDIFVAVGYLALAFVIYGGYMYLLSGGDTGKVAKGKKTLTAALVGLVIVLLASVIVNFIIGVLTGTN